MATPPPTPLSRQDETTAPAATAGSGERRALATDDAIGRKVAAQRLSMKLSSCLSVDLEVDKGTGRIHALAGV